MFELITALFWGTTIGFIASVPVGPVAIICFQRTIAKNRLSGLITGMGSAFADALLASIGAFGITVVYAFIKQEHGSIRIFGGLLLLIFGLFTFFSKPKDKENKPDTAITIIEKFLSGFILTITNPLAAFVFFIAFGNVSHKLGVGLHIAIPFVFGIFIGANIWWYLLTLIADRVAHKINHNHVVKLNKVFASIIIGFGFFILTSVLFK